MTIVPDSLQDSRIQTSMVAVRDGLTFEVDHCGDGEELALCLHGFPEHSFSWRHQLPMLADLGFTAWAPNLRGYGYSSRPAAVKDYAITELIEDVVRLIEASNKSKVTLIGHDWGGIIAWAFAIGKRLPLTRLIVCNCPHPRAYADAFGWAQFKKSLYVLFFQVPWLVEFLYTFRDARAIAEIFRITVAKESAFPTEVVDVFKRNASQPGAMRAMLNFYRAAMRYGSREDFGGHRPQIFEPMQVETLLIWGEEDYFLEKSTTFSTDQYVKHLTVRYLSGVSHWVQQEQPQAVNDMIKAFISGSAVPEYHQLEA